MTRTYKPKVKLGLKHPLNFNCVVCGRVVQDPNIDQLTCGCKKCKKTYQVYRNAINRQVYKLAKIKKLKDEVTNGRKNSTS